MTSPQPHSKYLGYGTAACYRGSRLYDTDETKAVVNKWVSWYKQHRQILISDIVHVRRPDMQGIDAVLHVNPNLREVGLLMVFNPTGEETAEAVLRVPLYYTGLTETAKVTDSKGETTTMDLSRGYEVDIALTMEPMSVEWFVFERP